MALPAAERWRRLEGLRQWCSDFAGFHLDDLGLERTEHAENLVLFFLANFEMVQGRDEILNEGIELAAGYLHPFVRVFHAASRVRAWPASCFTDLIDEHPRKPAQVGLCEFLIDPVIPGHSIPEILDDSGDGINSAQALI
jgi:hypothetical protein